MAIVKAWAEWLDFAGNSRATAFYAQSVVGAANIVTNIQALSNARLVRCTIADPTPPVSTGPFAADYPSVNDAAQLVYTPVLPGTSQLFIPAPMSFVFQPDGITVLLASVLLLNAAFTTFGCTLGGTPILLYVGGQRVGPKTAQLG